MLGDALYSLLSTVTANVYPGVVDQEINPPFCVHAVRKVVPHPSKDGASTKDIALVAIASYAKTQKAVNTLADSIRSTIDEYSGVVSSVDIENIRFQDQEEGYEEDVSLFQVLQTYKIWINYVT